MARSPRRLSGTVLGFLLLTLAACAPAPSFSIAQVDSGYRPVLEALQTTLSARIPDLNWSPTEPAGSFRDGRKCWVTILAHGYAPELVHWDDELRNSINATITQYGFAGQSRYSGETGGWVVMSSHDDAGVELEVATKAEIQLAIKARGDKDACS